MLLGQGQRVPDVVKVLGISEVSYYRRRQEYRGLSVSQAKRLKDLERENARLRQAVSDLSLDKVILQEATRDAPVDRQVAVPATKSACSVRNTSRASYRLRRRMISGFGEAFSAVRRAT